MASRYDTQFSLPALDDPPLTEIGIILLGLDAERLLAGLGLATATDDPGQVALAVDRLRHGAEPRRRLDGLVAAGAARWQAACRRLDAAGWRPASSGSLRQAWTRTLRLVAGAGLVPDPASGLASGGRATGPGGGSAAGPAGDRAADPDGGGLAAGPAGGGPAAGLAGGRAADPDGGGLAAGPAGGGSAAGPAGGRAAGPGGGGAMAARAAELADIGLGEGGPAILAYLTACWLRRPAVDSCAAERATT